MSLPIYVLSFSILVTGASVIAALGSYTRVAIAAVQDSAKFINQALLQHQQSVAQSLSESRTANGKALQSTTNALEKFANSIPVGATVLAHTKDTSGALKLEPTHTVQFK